MDFASAGLNNPELVRLDVDTKISNNLKVSELFCKKLCNQILLQQQQHQQQKIAPGCYNKAKCYAYFL